jgi:hypothetical protein
MNGICAKMNEKPDRSLFLSVGNKMFPVLYCQRLTVLRTRDVQDATVNLAALTKFNQKETKKIS